MTPDPSSARRTQTIIILPSALERLAARAARFPWWILIIGTALVLVFYSFLTSNLYRRTLAWVTDNPQISTDQFAEVIYDVQTPEGTTRRVQGILTARDGDRITITTQPEALTTIPRTDIGSLECAAPDASGDCPNNAQVSVLRSLISGALLFEDLGRYQIVTDYGNTLDVRKFTADVANVVRTPEGCTSDVEGRRCRVQIPLKPEEAANTISGLIVESTPELIVVQTSPRVTETINAAEIVRTVRYAPAQCALNNLAACDQGIFLSIFAAIAAFILAVVIGLIVALMRISTNPVFFNLSTVYVEVLRGIPLVVTLLIFGFALPPAMDEFPRLVPGITQVVIIGAGVLIAYFLFTRWPLRQIEPVALFRPVLITVLAAAAIIGIAAFFGANSNIRGIPAALLGLAVCYGAYLAELFRAGIQSIGRGQMEAARSLGMTYVQAMRFIILPQAFRVVLPPLGNEFIAMVKDSALLTILGLGEMTQRARIFAADTFRVWEPYITIAVLYLCMTLFGSFLVRTIERRLSAAR